MMLSNSQFLGTSVWPSTFSLLHCGLHSGKLCSCKEAIIYSKIWMRTAGILCILSSALSTVGWVPREPLCLIIFRNQLYSKSTCPMILSNIVCSGRSWIPKMPCITACNLCRYSCCWEYICCCCLFKLMILNETQTVFKISVVWATLLPPQWEGWLEFERDHALRV